VQQKDGQAVRRTTWTGRQSVRQSVSESFIQSVRPWGGGGARGGGGDLKGHLFGRIHKLVQLNFMYLL
jgi:hypothetical protein